MRDGIFRQTLRVQTPERKRGWERKQVSTPCNFAWPLRSYSSKFSALSPLPLRELRSSSTAVGSSRAGAALSLASTASTLSIFCGLPLLPLSLAGLSHSSSGADSLSPNAAKSWPSRSAGSLICASAPGPLGLAPPSLAPFACVLADGGLFEESPSCAFVLDAFVDPPAFTRTAASPPWVLG